MEGRADGVRLRQRPPSTRTTTIAGAGREATAMVMISELEPEAAAGVMLLTPFTMTLRPSSCRGGKGAPLTPPRPSLMSLPHLPAMLQHPVMLARFCCQR